MAASKKQQAERDVALERLRGLIKPGDTVHTLVRHVSRSGMSRDITLLIPDKDCGIFDISGLVATATGFRFNRDTGAVRVGGCGMDMCFHVVYELSRALFPEGYGCIGRSDDRSTWCPSSDHSNGDRDYRPHSCTWDAHAAESRMGNLHKCSEREVGQVGVGKFGVCHWHRDGGYAVRKVAI